MTTSEIFELDHTTSAQLKIARNMVGDFCGLIVSEYHKVNVFEAQVSQHSLEETISRLEQVNRLVKRQIESQIEAIEAEELAAEEERRAMEVDEHGFPNDVIASPTARFTTSAK